MSNIWLHLLGGVAGSFFLEAKADFSLCLQFIAHAESQMSWHLGLLLRCRLHLLPGLSAPLCHYHPAFAGFSSSQTSLTHWAADTLYRLISCLSSNKMWKGSNLDESFSLSWKGFYTFLVKPWPLFVLPYWPVKEWWGQRWPQRSPQRVVLW